MASSIFRHFLRYNKYGDPRQVVSLESDYLSTSLSPTSILVRWIASPINPLDINKIQGAYVLKMPLPCIPGSEAMGKVVKVGSEVRNVVPNDSIIIYAMECPTWAEYSVIDSCEAIKIDPRLSPQAGATLLVNPPTAWIMMKKFVDLRPGDWIIQNSANSGVGRAVIQLAKAYGFNSINIVRNRPEIAELKAELMSMGATMVLTEEEMAEKGAARRFAAKPRLALNGVGGRSCLAIAATLEHGATIVTYGGMSKQPHELSTSALVFNDIRAFGVAVGMWMREDKEGRKEEVDAMLQELQGLLLSGALTPPPMDEWPLHHFREALSRSMDGKHKKQCFIIQTSVSGKL